MSNLSFDTTSSARNIKPRPRPELSNQIHKILVSRMRPLFECMVVLFGPRKLLSGGRSHETGLHTRNELPCDEDGSQLKLWWRQLSICNVWMNYARPHRADPLAEGIEIISSA